MRSNEVVVHSNSGTRYIIRYSGVAGEDKNDDDHTIKDLVQKLEELQPDIKYREHRLSLSQLRHRVYEASRSRLQSPWDDIARQLKQYREAQRKTWGPIDDITIGKYLAGEASVEEIREVETAMETYPAVREAVELVRETLGE